MRLCDDKRVPAKQHKQNTLERNKIEKTHDNLYLPQIEEHQTISLIDTLFILDVTKRKQTSDRRPYSWRHISILREAIPEASIIKTIHNEFNLFTFQCHMICFFIKTLNKGKKWFKGTRTA